MTTKHEVLKEHLDDWLKARGNRKKRREIRDLICAAIKIHPNSVARAMRRLQLRDGSHPVRRGRRVLYGPNVTAALFDIWDAADRCCGELLHPIISEYVEILKRDGDWKHGVEATTLLLAMGKRTVKRRVLGLIKKHGGHGRGRSLTKPSSIKSLVPIFKGPWKDVLPGHGQIDTLAHCGESVAGDYVYSLNYTDAAVYWVVLTAQWNKGQKATLESLKTIRSRLPFPLLGLHPDTGSEFINWHALEWCQREKIDFSRSEPNRKNDNMFVEERNGHVIRRFLGYPRYDNPETVAAINELYLTLEVYLNHFKAVRRCVEKEKVGAKYKRKFETIARTPYQRVLEHPDIPNEVKGKLKAEHQILNPLRLRKQIDTLILRVYKIQKNDAKRVSRLVGFQ